MFSLNGFSKVIDGFSDINMAVKSFLDPLKQGSKNLDEAFKTMPGQSEGEKYAQTFSNQPEGDFKGELKNTMVRDNQGGVLSYKETGSTSKLNGTYVIKTYQVRFRGGQVKNMEFRFLQPTRGNEYIWTDAKFID